MNEREFGQRIAKARLAAGYSQKELAGRSGIAVRALQNLEAGNGSSLRTLLAVVNALDKQAWLYQVHTEQFSPLEVMARAEGKRRTRVSTRRHRVSIARPVRSSTP